MKSEAAEEEAYLGLVSLKDVAASYMEGNGGACYVPQLCQPLLLDPLPHPLLVPPRLHGSLRCQRAGQLALLGMLRWRRL